MGGRQPAGITFQSGYVYVGFTDCVVRYPYKTGDTEFQGKPERLIDLPGGGNHYARHIAFSRDGFDSPASVPHRASALVQMTREAGRWRVGGIEWRLRPYDKEQGRQH